MRYRITRRLLPKCELLHAHVALFIKNRVWRLHCRAIEGLWLPPVMGRHFQPISTRTDGVLCHGRWVPHISTYAYFAWALSSVDLSSKWQHRRIVWKGPSFGIERISDVEKVCTCLHNMSPKQCHHLLGSRQSDAFALSGPGSAGFTELCCSDVVFTCLFSL